ncbi:hypothetical protein C7S13_4441 [Burkholderia cepacia]|nr:hypothetical protein [Burkholderia cepacia]
MSGARHAHLDILAETVRRLVMAAKGRPARAGGNRHGTSVAAAFRGDDSR